MTAVPSAYEESNCVAQFHMRNVEHEDPVERAHVALRLFSLLTVFPNVMAYYPALREETAAALARTKSSVPALGDLDLIRRFEMATSHFERFLRRLPKNPCYRS